MADDVAVTAGAGTTIATDEVSGRHFQRIKVTWGTDGTATDASASNPLPVTISGIATSAKQDDIITALGSPFQAGGSVTVSGSVAVTGTFWQATQPVSAAALPLPSGASTAAKQPALGTAGTASADVITVQGIASMTALKVDGSAVTQPVSGTFWQATQPISAVALPLPSGASTAAKQPALGTAGSASADVLTVQGIASMTALKVDGSAVTQPVSFAASESHLGEVSGPISYIDVTLSLDTSAYAAGDLLADTQVVTNAMRVNDGLGVLYSMVAVDEDDQGVGFDVWFLSANNTMGTENSAPSISDANARDILGRVTITAGDWIDLGGVRVASITNIGLVVKPASGTRNLYVAAVNGSGAPTFTASGVKLRLGFLQN